MDSSDSDSSSERRVRTNSDAFYDDDPDDGDVADYLNSLAMQTHPPPLLQPPPDPDPDPDHIPCEICRRMVSFATYTDHIEVCLMQTSVHMIGQRHQSRMRTADGGVRVTFMRNRTEDDIMALEMATRVLGMSLMPSMTNEYEYNLWLQDRMGGSVNVGVADKEAATTKIDDPAEMPDDAVCTICLETPEAPIRKTACNHYFCQGCIFKWLDTSRKCPNCAHVLSG
jgi:hypothetical protein